MKYALLIYPHGARAAFEALSDEERQTVIDEYRAISDLPEVIGGEQVHPASTATTVRVVDGDVVLTDGPYPAPEAALGGFYILEADRLEEATAVAARVPASRMGGAVEVRAIVAA